MPRLGPIIHTPRAGHPYYGRDGWGNIMHGKKYYPTEAGLNYYYMGRESAPRTQTDLWLDVLFNQEPKTRQAYVDRTNDLFNSQQTMQDHHAAEYVAAEMLSRKFITFDPNEAAEE